MFILFREKEFYFFDTLFLIFSLKNILLTFLEYFYSIFSIRVLLRHQARTEAMSVTTIGIRTIKRKGSCITTIVVSSTTIEERITQPWKVRGVLVLSLFFVIISFNFLLVKY